MFWQGQNTTIEKESASGFLKRSLDHVLNFRPYQKLPKLQLGEGWSSVSAPSISKLQRRTEINAQRGNTPRPFLEIYKTLFLHQLKTKFVGYRKRVYEDAPPYWKLKVNGWHNSEMDLTVFVASGDDLAGAAPDWQFSAVWVFDTFEADYSDIESCQAKNDRTWLIDPNDYSELFLAPILQTEKATDRVHPTYLWQRSRDQVTASSLETGAWSTTHERKFSVASFQNALLPTFALPKISRLYATEHFYLSYN